MRGVSLKEASLKHKELYVLLSLGLSSVVFLKFFFGTRLLIQLPVLVMVGLLLLFTSAIKWKLSLYFFFLWLLLEGILRKWVAPGLSTPIFFFKYFVLAGPFLYMFFKGSKMAKKDYPFFGFILLYLVWGVFEAFNFRATDSFRVHALGFAIHFFFIPLIFLVPQLLDTEEKILNLFKIISYVSIPIFMLGVVQYFSPVSSPINQYVAPEAGIATVGTTTVFPRITGVFSYISIYGSYLAFSVMGILYLILAGDMNRFARLLLYVAGSLGVANIIMTGSRGVVILFVLKALLLFLLAFRPRLRRWRRAFVSFALFIAASLFLVLFTDVGKTSLGAFAERVEASEDLKSRLMGTYAIFKFLPDAGLTGYGMGTTYQGSSLLVENWGDMPREFEGEWERILLELGLIGFVIVFLLRLYILLYSWRVFKRVESHELKLIALLVFIFQIPTVIGFNNVVYNYFENIIYWFLVGLAVSVNRLGRGNASKGFGLSPK